MKCPKVRLYMGEYHRGILKAGCAARIERHLKHCRDCADHFALEKRFCGVLEQALAGDEDFKANVDRMWDRIEACIRIKENEHYSISPAFFRKAMAYCCASILIILAFALYIGRGWMPIRGPVSASAPCYRFISPTPGSPYEKETVNLLDPDVYSIEDITSFLLEMRRPARADLFTECYPQLPAVHAQFDHL